MSKLAQNSLVAWIILTLAITGLSWLGGKDGGSSSNPVYLTRAERADPSLLFVKLLPGGALIALIIVAVVAIIIYFSKKKK